MLIFMHLTIPRRRRNETATYSPREVEHCATFIFPNYNFARKSRTTEVKRRPYSDHSLNKDAPDNMQRNNVEHQIATTFAGDLRINLRKTGFKTWVDGTNPSKLTSPDSPTYIAGTTDDTIVFTIGNYPPGGVLPPVPGIET